MQSKDDIIALINMRLEKQQQEYDYKMQKQKEEYDLKLEKQKIENEFKLEKQKKEYEDRISCLERNTSNLMRKDDKKTEIIDKQNESISSVNREIYKLKEVDSILNEKVERVQAVTLPLMPIKNIYTPSEILKVNSSDDEGDSIKKDDDAFDNVSFMALISDDVKSYPWHKGRGFLDTFAYFSPCRAHKRAIDTLKLAASEGDDKTLRRIINENIYMNIDGRGMADSLCSRISGFYDKTALMLASEAGHFTCAKILLDKGADICKLDRENLTALDYAKANSNHDVIYLLEKYHARTGSDVLENLEKNKNNNFEMKLKVN